MSSFIDKKALQVAQRLAQEHGIQDSQTIAFFQLGAIAALQEAYEPYSILDTVELDEQGVKAVSSLVFDAALPKECWASATDEHGIALTLARQRRLIADQIKDGARTGRLSVSPDRRLNLKLVAALKAARGWVVTAIESATARRDLITVDQALDAASADYDCTCRSYSSDDAYEPGGPSSGKRRPPPCKATTHCR